MIVSAAVKILDKKQNKEIVLPCHRHCDIFYILKEFGYKKNIDYEELAQGFLDEKDNFYNRIEAHEHAWIHDQLPNEQTLKIMELFSEDLY